MKINYADYIRLFEETIAEYVGSKYCIAVDSCTNGLFLCLKYMNISNEILEIPTHTYPSVPMQIIHSGNKVKFKDIEWTGFYKLDPYNIYDCAGHFERNMYIQNSFMVLSFQFKKILNIGKGGMIMTDDKTAYDILCQMRLDGRQSDFWKEDKDVNVLGYHMNMTPEEAIRGLEIFKNIKDNHIVSKFKWTDYPDISNYSVFGDYKCL